MRGSQTTCGAPAHGTQMGHIVMAFVAVGSIDDNSRGGSGRALVPERRCYMSGCVRTEGLGDLPQPQYRNSTAWAQSFSYHRAGGR